MTGHARADEGKIWGAPTLFATVSFGDKTVFGIGLDARMTVLGKGGTDACSDRTRWGGGPFAQATWLIPGGARFALGGHLGSEVVSHAYSADGEIGWTYRSAIGTHPGGHGLHLGIANSFFLAEQLAIRTAFSSFHDEFVAEGTIALGGGFPQAFGVPFTCILD